MPDVLVDIWKWVKEDHKAWPLRFYLEVSAWLASIGCSFTMMLTIPHPPFAILYPLFISQCLVFGWSAWTRKSFGMVANYMLLVSIDTVALTRLLLQ
jgi:hypothetical protein